MTDLQPSPIGGGATIADLRQQVQELAEQRDALAAHVELQSKALERLVSAMRLYEMDADCDHPPPRDHRNMMKHAESMLVEAPATSLARHVNEEQAEFLDEMADQSEQDSTIQWTPRELRCEAKRLRQIKGEDS